MAISRLHTDGQLDWVALGSSTFSYSLDLASRVERAGVETRTLLVAQYICSTFNFPADGQMVVKDSLSRIKGYSSFDNTIYFVLGVKSILHLLLETEGGVACIAVSAALVFYHSPHHAAEVWREFCILKGALADYRPAFQQWKALVDSCSYSLHRSSFQQQFDQFSRWLAPETSARRDATPPIRLAEALQALADISLGMTADVTFVGGVECAWLAALANLIFRLPVEVVDEDGGIICPCNSNKHQFKIIFRRERTTQVQDSSNKVALAQKTFYLASGDKLLHQSAGFLASTIRCRSNWSTVFRDTFPAWHEFSTSPCSKHLKELLKLVTQSSQTYFSSSPRLRRDSSQFPWWLQWGPRKEMLYHPRRTGHALYQFALDTFRELQSLPDAQVRTGDDEKDILSSMLGVVMEIQSCCPCYRCKSTHSKSRPLQHYPICFSQLSLTIIRLILILSRVVKIDLDIPLVPGALKTLYDHCLELRFLPQDTPIPSNGVEIVLYLFSSQYIPRSRATSDFRVSGASSGGVCVFFRMLKNLDSSPEDLVGIEIMPGLIQHENHLYDWIIDISEIEQPPFTKDIFDFFSRKSLQEKPSQIQLVAKETREARLLSASYEANDEDGRFMMPLVTIESILLQALNFHHCCCERSPCALEIGRSRHQWSPWESLQSDKDQNESVKAKSQIQFNFPFRVSWIVLDWQMYQIAGTAGKSIESISIDLYYVGNHMLGLLLLLLQRKRSRSLQILSGTAISLGCRDLNCAVRVFLSDWSKDGNVAKGSVKNLRMLPGIASKLANNTRKASIRFHSIVNERPSDPLTLQVLTTEIKARTTKSNSDSWSTIFSK